MTYRKRITLTGPNGSTARVKFYSDSDEEAAQLDYAAFVDTLVTFGEFKRPEAEAEPKEPEAEAEAEAEPKGARAMKREQPEELERQEPTER